VDGAVVPSRWWRDAHGLVFGVFPRCACAAESRIPLSDDGAAAARRPFADGAGRMVIRRPAAIACVLVGACCRPQRRDAPQAADRLRSRGRPDSRLSLSVGFAGTPLRAISGSDRPPGRAGCDRGVHLEMPPTPGDHRAWFRRRAATAIRCSFAAHRQPARVFRARHADQRGAGLHLQDNETSMPVVVVDQAFARATRGLADRATLRSPVTAGDGERRFDRSAS
jgi:hypothetical protein